MEEKKQEKKEKALILSKDIVKFLAIIVFAAASFNFGQAVSAASLYFSPASGSCVAGKNFSVGVYVSSADQALNAASGVISFFKDKWEVASLSRSGSIFNLWVKDPSYSNAQGTISFEGIVLNPGFKGKSGEIMNINFKAKEAGTATLAFSSGLVLANDGKGSNILSGLGKASYSIAAPAPVAPPAVKAPPVVTPAPAVPAATTTPPVVTPAPEATTTPPVAAPELPAPVPPIIDRYPSRLSGDAILVVQGTTYSDINLIVWLQKEQNKPQSFQVGSDKNGNFTFVYDKKLKDGVYWLWAEAIDARGVKSSPSPGVVIIAGQPMAWKIGPWSANSFALALLFLNLIIFLAVFFWRLHTHKVYKLLKNDVYRQIEILEKTWAKRPLSAKEDKILKRLRKDVSAGKYF